MNYSIPPIFTELNNTQKNEYSYRDRWGKWREHLKKNSESMEENSKGADSGKAAQSPVLLEKQRATVGFSPTHDAQATTLFHTTLLTHG